MTHSHSEIQESPYAPKQIFDLVADVARYPEFLPWCRAARILSRESDRIFYAELVIAYKHLTERYTSRVTLGQEGEVYTIHVEMTEGPFHHLTNQWRMVPDGKGGTHIHFALDFAFRSKLLDSLLGGFFAKASSKMAEAFKERADKLYGDKV